MGLFLQLSRGADRNQPSVTNHSQPVALFCFIHDMCCDNQRFAAVFQIIKSRPNTLTENGVDANRRLIEDQQFRFMQQCSSKRKSSLHAARVIGYQFEDEIYVDDKGFFNKFKEAVMTGNMAIITRPKGKLLISSLAAGITNEDIELLKNLLKENKIQDRFRIKKGVPFAPSIFIGLIISIFIGDIAFILQKVIYTILYT